MKQLQSKANRDIGNLIIQRAKCLIAQSLKVSPKLINIKLKEDKPKIKKEKDSIH